MNCPDCNRPMTVIKTDSGGAYFCNYCTAKWVPVRKGKP